MKVIYYGTQLRERYKQEYYMHGSLYHPEELAKDKINNPHLYISRTYVTEKDDVILHEKVIEDEVVKLLYKEGDKLLLKESECNVMKVKYDSHDKTLKVYTDYISLKTRADRDEYEKIIKRVIAHGKDRLERMNSRNSNNKAENDGLFNKKWYQFWK